MICLKSRPEIVRKDSHPACFSVIDQRVLSLLPFKGWRLDGMAFRKHFNTGKFI